MRLKKGGNFEVAPEGVHDGVCIDIVEGIRRATPWGEKDKIRIVWELPEVLQTDGRPFIVMKEYTPSIAEKSNLYRDLKGWFGRGPEDEFDTDDLIGHNAQLVVQHNEKGENTYANIITLMKPKKKLESSGHYVRVQDRPDAAPPPSDAPLAEEDMDIPF